jgi:hypothetical protein
LRRLCGLSVYISALRAITFDVQLFALNRWLLSLFLAFLIIGEERARATANFDAAFAVHVKVALASQGANLRRFCLDDAI